MAIDIFAPEVSVVTRDLNGKTLLIYGTNRTGKTLQLTRLPKPYYLAFERGINAIHGIPFAPIQRWSDYIAVVRQLTSKATVEKARALYQTLILDQAEAMALLCEQYILEKFGVESLGASKKDANGKVDRTFNGWKEYSKEFERQLRLLTSVGYTVAFIAHEGTRTYNDAEGKEYTKIYPKGDKRAIDPICDLVDIIGFAATNGVDENGQPRKSSLYLTQTQEYHAGSRFTYLPPVLPEFTAEALTEALANAVTQLEAAEGVKAVSFEEQAAAYVPEALPDFETVKNEIGAIAQALHGAGQFPRYQAVVDTVWGKDKKVSEATPDQIQVMVVILDELRSLWSELAQQGLVPATAQ